MTRSLAAPSRTDDPDTPTEAVGSWPAIDIARLGLPPLGWLFVAGAVFVAVAHLRPVGDLSPEEVPADVASAFAAALVTLIPAALLWRWHDAIQTHPFLFAGLACGAAVELVRGVLWFWPVVPAGAAWTRSILDGSWPVLTALGSLLVGLGLLRLRSTATRVRLLAVIALTYVGLSVLTFAVGPGLALLDPYGAVLQVLGPAAAAVAVWVPVSAWLDREAPRTFWALLAIGLPVTLVLSILELAATVAVGATRSNALFLPTLTVNGTAGAILSTLALVAFARLTPESNRRA